MRQNGKMVSLDTICVVKNDKILSGYNLNSLITIILIICSQSKNSKSLGSEKGNDDGRTKKRPFKVGPYRANSAVESYNSKNTTKTNSRLTRSKSVESTGISKQIVCITILTDTYIQHIFIYAAVYLFIL